MGTDEGTTAREDVRPAGVDQGVRDVAGALGGSVRCWARLAANRRLIRPRRHVGARLRFADGTESRVFRETTLLGARLTLPCVLVVRFRLRLIGRAGPGHTLFRAGCVVNTPLFAGFPGFVTKLWLADLATGEYRGVYDWNGAEAARDYAEPLTALLRVGSLPGSVDYHVVPDLTRERYLRGPGPVEAGTTAGPSAAPGSWWQLREPMIPPARVPGW